MHNFFVMREAFYWQLKNEKEPGDECTTGEGLQVSGPKMQMSLVHLRNRKGWKGKLARGCVT